MNAPSHEILRECLEAELRHYRESLVAAEEALFRAVDPQLWELISSYAHYRAREYHTRQTLERMGWN